MSVKTHVYIDGSWMFHNKKFLVEAYGEEDYDVDYKKIPLIIQEHLLNNLTIDVDIVRTYFYGTMPVNKPGLYKLIKYSTFNFYANLMIF